MIEMFDSLINKVIMTYSKDDYYEIRRYLNECPDFCPLPTQDHVIECHKKFQISNLKLRLVSVDPKSVIFRKLL